MSITFFGSSYGSVSFTFEDTVFYQGLGKRSYKFHEGVPDGLVFQNDIEAILRYTEDRIKQFLQRDVDEDKRIVDLVQAYSGPFSVMYEYYPDRVEGRVDFSQGKLVFRMTAPYDFDLLPHEFPEWEEEKGWLGLFDVEPDGGIILKRHLRQKAIWALGDAYTKKKREEVNTKKMVEELNRSVDRIKIR